MLSALVKIKCKIPPKIESSKKKSLHLSLQILIELPIIVNTQEKKQGHQNEEDSNKQT
jgi:hypothetical protein